MKNYATEVIMNMTMKIESDRSLVITLHWPTINAYEKIIISRSIVYARNL
jgi:hypothetical protein